MSLLACATFGMGAIIDSVILSLQFDNDIAVTALEQMADFCKRGVLLRKRSHLAVMIFARGTHRRKLPKRLCTQWVKLLYLGLENPGDIAESVASATLIPARRTPSSIRCPTRY
jgi:hypothetical protein